MCGLCGVIGPAQRAAPERVEAMARTLRHRGPDDFGTWSRRFAAGNAEHAVAFGHTRLAILDLSPLGHQPMHAADGSITVVYNGEIYNFRALREELRALGSHFRSESDTEVLIEAWRHWGTAAFDRFVGMFAIAIWDAPRQRLVLARDRLGIKPLYYAFDDGLLLFASELRALREHPVFEPSIDRASLADLLQHGYVTGPGTIYSRVRRLQPGELLIWERGRVTASRYWSLEEPAAEPPPASFDAAVDRLEQLLGDAVELRLIADVPLGAFLSGGIDSSAVVALMQERSSRGVRTFSIGFEDPAFDEAPFARAVAKHLGTDHTELYVGWEQAAQVARELPDLYDEPFADSSAIPTVLLSRLTRQHVTVALSGDGGDELFGGYAHYRRLAWLAPWVRMPVAVRRGLAGALGWIPQRSLRRALGYLRGERLVDVAEAMYLPWDPRALRAALGAAAPDGSRIGYRAAFEAAPASEAARRAMLADARTYLPDDILTKVDRASMSVGLEARVPILDHRVVRFAFSLPLPLLWHGGLSKAPLQALAWRRIPRALLERPKHGFAIPLERLLGGDLRRWSERYLAPSRLAEEGIFDPNGVARLVEQARPFAPGGTSPLWYLLCFQRWFAHNHRGEPLD